MKEDEIETLAFLLLIAVGALIRRTPPRRRTQVLADITREVGDPRVVPVHDGDALRRGVELRALLDRVLPSWLA